MAHTSFSLSRSLRRNRIWWGAGAILLVILAFYFAGFRIGPGLSIVRVGTLVLTEVPEGSSVYVNSKLRSVTGSAGDYRARLTPGTHTVIVAVPNSTPWQDALTIPSNGTLSIKPIIIPNRPDGDLLLGEARAAARRVVDANALPTEAKPLRAGCTDIFVSQNRILGKAAPGCETPPDYLCTEGGCGTTELFAPIEKITSIALYPGREDALFFTIGDGVYAMDIDPREPRFFAPFVRSVLPRIAAGTSTNLLLSFDDKAYSYPL